jgi:hypothetical protein
MNTLIAEAEQSDGQDENQEDHQKAFVVPTARLYNMWKKPFAMAPGANCVPAQNGPEEIFRANPALASGGIRVLRG